MKNHVKQLFRFACLIASFQSIVSAQNFTNLHDFTGDLDGQYPAGRLILSQGILFGVATSGGAFDNGTVYSLSTNGTGFTTLHSFSASSGSNAFDSFTAFNSDGFYPASGLTLAGDTLYGTAEDGGSAGFGTLFSVGTNGDDFSAFHDFSTIPQMYPATNSDGAYPLGNLMVADGEVYGTASQGGSFANGTIFKAGVGGGGGFTVLHTFAEQSEQTSGVNDEGANPRAGLVLSGSVLYGAAYQEGANSYGSIFSMNTDGSGFTNLHDFSAGDGSNPWGDLLLSGNTLYGTASKGGTNGTGTIFSINTDGTGFKVVHGFELTRFGTNSEGANPQGGLIASNGLLYGTAEYAGANGNGTVFSLNPDGSAFTVLHTFNRTVSIQYTNSDGANPGGDLVLSNGVLYGEAQNGGAYGYGTVFSVSTHPAFFTGEIPLGGGVYYLAFPSTNLFGTYTYAFFPYLYHYDLGFEYFFDANDSAHSAYFFDFTSGHFWYTSPAVFPNLYDFGLNSWIYYFPDTTNSSRYSSNPRNFFNYTTGQYITQ